MEPSNRALREVRNAFKALSDVSRLRIMLELADFREAPVSELATKLKISQPLISWHLRTLRRVGVVSKRRSGRISLYSVNRQRLQWCQDQLGLLGTGQLTASGDTSTLPRPADSPV